jgi:myo-inositol-1-phosphate synthase
MLVSLLACGSFSVKGSGRQAGNPTLRAGGQGGILTAPAAYFCKHPPKQFTDDEAYRMTEAFIQEK